jgi:hypothetical protein
MEYLVFKKVKLIEIKYIFLFYFKNQLKFLGVWLLLFFKVIFIWKCIKIKFFYFLKIIFDISTWKWSENIKKKFKQKNK